MRKATESGGSILKGLKRTIPPGTDKSGFITRKGGSVNSGASRGSKPAKSPSTMGPRSA